MIGDDDAMRRRYAFHVTANMQAGQNQATRSLQPSGPLLERQRAANAQKPIAKDAMNQCNAQRHSASDATPGQEVKGARKRLRAEGANNFRSSSVRKSIVPNSRSHAGGAQMRAPIAR